METIQILICGMLWIISGLFVAFLMIFSDMKLKELGVTYPSLWILNKSNSAIFVLVIFAPLSLFVGFFVLLFMIDDIKKMKT